MANINQEEARARRQRQYEIDRITARYKENYRAGKAPRLEEYLQRYPDFARELKEFALYFHSIAVDLPEPDPIPGAEVSQAAKHVLAQITLPAPKPDTESLLPGLVKPGLTVGYTPSKLAEALGIAPDVLAKLEARVIAAATIPYTLIQCLADTLHVSPEALANYLGGTSTAQGGAFYYADQAPAQQQESFLEAIHASPLLTTERKQEWAEIVKRETPDT